jgi:hypothetical protein
MKQKAYCRRFTTGRPKGIQMTVSLRRQALTANGLLLVLGSILCGIRTLSSVGTALTLFMAISLIFSGSTDFCGWLKILSLMPWNRNAGQPPERLL